MGSATSAARPATLAGAEHHFHNRERQNRKLHNRKGQNGKGLGHRCHDHKCPQPQAAHAAAPVSPHCGVAAVSHIHPVDVRKEDRGEYHPPLRDTHQVVPNHLAYLVHQYRIVISRHSAQTDEEQDPYPSSWEVPHDDDEETDSSDEDDLSLSDEDDLTPYISSLESMTVDTARAPSPPPADRYNGVGPFNLHALNQRAASPPQATITPSAWAGVPIPPPPARAPTMPPRKEN